MTLRRDHHRDGCGRRHPRPPPRAVRESASCSSSGGLAPREPQNWDAADVFADNRYVSEDTWYDDKGKTFQPQIHYFVGGATKLYGAALYRLRKEDFGELQHHDGVSPAWPIEYEELEPYYTQAEHLYEVHGARGRGPDRAAGECAVPISGGLARAADPAALRRPRRGGTPPVPRAVRDPAERGEHALQPLRPLRDLRRISLSRPCEVGRRGARRAPCARASQRHAPDERESDEARDRSSRRARSRRWSSSADGETERFAGDVVVLACGAANTAKLLLASANDHHPNGLANGSDQVGRNYMFHDSLAVLALSREENPTVFQKTLGAERLLLRQRRLRVPAREHPDGGQVVGGDVPRREAARDEARPRVDARPGRPPRNRLLALHRGPAPPGEPRHPRC